MRYQSLMRYRTVYGYSWPAAVAAQFWWHVERLLWRWYRGEDGGLFGAVNRFGYTRRKAAERRGSAGL